MLPLHTLGANHHYLLAADLHLSADSRSRVSAFCAMMAQAPKCADAVYLLGDLFDAWPGDDENANWAEQVRQAIHRLTEQGMPVYIQHGNRDFLLGRRFNRMTGGKLLPDFCAVSLAADSSEEQLADAAKSQDFATISKRRFLLTHGDLLCDDDNYLRYRRRVRSRLFLAFVAVLPLFLRRKLAAKMMEGSSRRRQAATISRARVTAALRKWESATLIHGHTHNAGFEEWQDDGDKFCRRCLPDWENAPGYVLLSADGGMTQYAVENSENNKNGEDGKGGKFAGESTESRRDIST